MHPDAVDVGEGVRVWCVYTSGRKGGDRSQGDSSWKSPVLSSDPEGGRLCLVEVKALPLPMRPHLSGPPGSTPAASRPRSAFTSAWRWSLSPSVKGGARSGSGRQRLSLQEDGAGESTGGPAILRVGFG